MLRRVVPVVAVLLFLSPLARATETPGEGGLEGTTPSGGGWGPSIGGGAVSPIEWVLLASLGASALLRRRRKNGGSSARKGAVD